MENNDYFIELIWVSIGLISYVTMVIFMAYTTENFDFNKEVAENPSAGQTFIIAIVTGPIFPVLLIAMFSEDYFRERKVSNTLLSGHCPECGSKDIVIHVSNQSYHAHRKDYIVELDMRCCKSPKHLFMHVYHDAIGKKKLIYDKAHQYKRKQQ